MTSPDGIGPQKPDDPRGWLVFDWLPADLQNAEDSTLAADRGEHPGLHRSVHFSPPTDFAYVRSRFTRPATATERVLLEHLGYDLPDDLTTRVHWISSGVRNRSWPQLQQGN